MILGVEAIPITVEATARGASDGTPRILGLVDTAVREAYHRVLNAFHALGLPSPRGVTTVNFAPGSLRKHGAGFDLPLALALAGAAGLFTRERTADLFAYGEVSLRGELLPARGAACVALMARAGRGRTLLCGIEDAALCQGIDGIRVRGAATLADALYWVSGQRELPPVQAAASRPSATHPDLADVRGHETGKLALSVAAAGGHNLLFIGPPGSGKTALCRRLPGLLPEPTTSERLEILQVHTAAGQRQLPRQRPLRAPHHSSSCASLLGGGHELRPGEVSMAHRGVLFLDELPEFRRDALEALRQPLEDGLVTVGRARQTVMMPAAFTLVAAMNPCPCGFRGHQHRPCTCLPATLARYRGRLSGPLLDRLDLQVEIPALDPAVLRRPPDAQWATTPLRTRVLRAHARQLQRNGTNGRTPLANARLQDQQLERACRAEEAVEDTLEDVLRLHGQGGRARVRLLRVARTLADLDDRDRLEPRDVLEAANLRGFARAGTLD